VARDASLVDVRRLAAVDMYGTQGTERRRRIIIAEFVLAALGGIAVGLYLLLAAGGAAIVIGVVAIGVGVNYVPLAAHAISLRAPATLRAELAGSDVRGELRRYSVSQFWVFVPFLFAVLALAQRR